MTDRRPDVSIVVPAYDEERLLPRLLERLADARARLPADATELIVVDNRSTDATARIARDGGARVIEEAAVGVSHARNAGGRAARGETILFLDADVEFPPELVERVAAAMADPRCLGGAADAIYRPARRALRLYLAMWRVLAKAMRMRQGAAQFVRGEVFEALGGYDVRQYMGEDVDFVWRLRKLARARGGTVDLLDGLAVVPSSRRFDQWPLWRTLVFTHPWVIGLLRHRESAWRGWYRHPPR